jgi:DNA-binding winged helix-turn-helix (wHTH) protein
MTVSNKTGFSSVQTAELSSLTPVPKNGSHTGVFDGALAKTASPKTLSAGVSIAPASKPSDPLFVKSWTGKTPDYFKSFSDILQDPKTGKKLSISVAYYKDNNLNPLAGYFLIDKNGRRVDLDFSPWSHPDNRLYALEKLYAAGRLDSKLLKPASVKAKTSAQINEAETAKMIGKGLGFDVSSPAARAKTNYNFGITFAMLEMFQGATSLVDAKKAAEMGKLIEAGKIQARKAGFNDKGWAAALGNAGYKLSTMFIGGEAILGPLITKLGALPKIGTLFNLGAMGVGLNGAAHEAKSFFTELSKGDKADKTKLLNAGGNVAMMLGLVAKPLLAKKPVLEPIPTLNGAKPKPVRLSRQKSPAIKPVSKPVAKQVRLKPKPATVVVAGAALLPPKNVPIEGIIVKPHTETVTINGKQYHIQHNQGFAQVSVNGGAPITLPASIAHKDPKVIAYYAETHAANQRLNAQARPTRHRPERDARLAAKAHNNARKNTPEGQAADKKMRQGVTNMAGEGRVFTNAERQEIVTAANNSDGALRASQIQTEMETHGGTVGQAVNKLLGLPVETIVPQTSMTRTAPEVTSAPSPRAGFSERAALKAIADQNQMTVAQVLAAQRQHSGMSISDAAKAWRRDNPLSSVRAAEAQTPAGTTAASTSGQTPQLPVAKLVPFENYSLDAQKNILKIGTHDLKLNDGQMKLMQVLLDNKGKIVSTHDLQVACQTFAGENVNISSLISTIKVKLTKIGIDFPISPPSTNNGYGYGLSVSEAALASKKVPSAIVPEVVTPTTPYRDPSLADASLPKVNISIKSSVFSKGIGISTNGKFRGELNAAETEILKILLKHEGKTLSLSDFRASLGKNIHESTLNKLMAKIKYVLGTQYVEHTPDNRYGIHGLSESAPLPEVIKSEARKTAARDAPYLPEAKTVYVKPQGSGLTQKGVTAYPIKINTKNLTMNVNGVDVHLDGLELRVMELIRARGGYDLRSIWGIKSALENTGYSVGGYRVQQALTSINSKVKTAFNLEPNHKDFIQLSDEKGYFLDKLDLVPNVKKPAFELHSRANIHELVVNGKKYELTYPEFKLLSIFTANKNASHSVSALSQKLRIQNVPYEIADVERVLTKLQDQFGENSIFRVNSQSEYHFAEPTSPVPAATSGSNLPALSQQVALNTLPEPVITNVALNQKTIPLTDKENKLFKIMAEFHIIPRNPTQLSEAFHRVYGKSTPESKLTEVLYSLVDKLGDDIVQSQNGFRLSPTAVEAFGTVRNIGYRSLTFGQENLKNGVYIDGAFKQLTPQLDAVLKIYFKDIGRALSDADVQAAYLASNAGVKSAPNIGVIRNRLNEALGRVLIAKDNAGDGYRLIRSSQVDVVVPAPVVVSQQSAPVQSAAASAQKLSPERTSNVVLSNIGSKYEVKSFDTTKILSAEEYEIVSIIKQANGRALTMQQISSALNVNHSRDIKHIRSVINNINSYFLSNHRFIQNTGSLVSFVDPSQL